MSPHYALTQQRNQYPAAVLKDRHSRTGLDKTQWNHKNGDGAHNWGSTARKGDDEASGRLDGEAEAEAALDELPSSDVFDLDEEINDPVGAMPVTDSGNDFKPMDLGKRGSIQGQSNIATSPTDSMSSLDSGDRPGMGRRMSAVSDEEREKMRLYREGVLHKKQGVDLAHIARSSHGIAMSPPTNSYLGPVSPSNTRYGFNFVSVQL